MITEHRHHLRSNPACLMQGLFLVCGLCLIACSFFSRFTSPSQTAAPAEVVPVSIERTALSGIWLGTETLTAVGSCRLEQGDTVTNPVKMLWSVDEAGQTTIALPDWPGVFPYTFAGEIQPDLSISLEFASKALCGGIESPYGASYDSAIQAQGSTLILDMESTEVWCPGTCIFVRHYSVRKTIGEP
jgi:hypothetical protein